MKIAIFDYQVIRTNPIGGCHRRMLNALADEHEFTVFSVQFDNPRPDRIRWVRIPAPLRPLPLLFVTYHLLAPLVYGLHRWREGQTFEAVQTVESKLAFGDIAYTHFCHTSYLKNHWTAGQSSGMRGWSRWLDHRLHALLERHSYHVARQILVPSQGLAQEVADEFPETGCKLRVLPNAIDVEGLIKPSSFDRGGFREGLGIRDDEVVFCFAALGHFERKGLPLLLRAIAETGAPAVKLLVVGGTTDLVEKYRRAAQETGVQGRVVFAGMKSDVRPYFWASDAFVLASTYETFSLVAFEAAAASLPLITTSVHGVDEIVREGETGFVVKRSVENFAAALKRFVELAPEERAAMGGQARLSAQSYDERRFVKNWRQFYTEWTAAVKADGRTSEPARPVHTL